MAYHSSLGLAKKIKGRLADPPWTRHPPLARRPICKVHMTPGLENRTAPEITSQKVVQEVSGGPTMLKMKSGCIEDHAGLAEEIKGRLAHPTAPATPSLSAAQSAKYT